MMKATMTTNDFTINMEGYYDGCSNEDNSLSFQGGDELNNMINCDHAIGDSSMEKQRVGIQDIVIGETSDVSSIIETMVEEYSTDLPLCVLESDYLEQCKFSDEEVDDILDKIQVSSEQYLSDVSEMGYMDDYVEEVMDRLHDSKVHYLSDNSADSMILYMNHLSVGNTVDRLYPPKEYVLIIRKDQAYMQRHDDGAIYHLNHADVLCGNYVHTIIDMINEQYPQGGTTIYHYYDVCIGLASELNNGYRFDNKRIKMPTKPRVKRERQKSTKKKKEKRKESKVSSMHTDPSSLTGKSRRHGFVPNAEQLYLFDNHYYTMEELDYLHDIFGDALHPQDDEETFLLSMGSRFSSDQLFEFIQGLGSKITPENSKTFGMVEGFLLAVVSVFDSKTFIGQCAAIAQYIRPYLNSDGSALIYVKEMFENCFEDAGIRPVGDPTGLAPQSTIFSRIKEFKDLPVFKHCCTAASLLVGFGFIQQSNFTRDCAKKFAGSVAPVQEKSRDFFSCVLDTLDFFLDRGYTCYMSGSLEPFFNLNDEHTEFQRKLAFLKANIVEVKAGNFEDLHKDKTPALTLGDFVDTIDFCRKYVKTNLLTAQIGWKSTLAGYLAVIEKIQNEYHIHASSSSMRCAPFCVKIHGGSGVCKSSLYRYTVNSILTYNNYDASDDKIVNLDPDDKFEPNMRSNTNAVIFDDMANTSSAFIAMAPTSKLIKIVNNAPAYANMPEAEMKGRVLMNPKLVVITTNVEDLCAGTYSNEPFSLLRRCHVHATVKLRANLLDKDAKLDQQLLTLWEENSKSTYEDMWLITMKTVKEEVNYDLNKRSKASQYQWSILCLPHVNDGKPLEDIDIFTFMKVCCELSKEHYRVQGLIVAKQANIADKAIRCTCRGPINSLGACIMCGSTTKLVAGLKPQAGLVSNLLELTSNSMQLSTWQLALAQHAFKQTTNFMSSVTDVFTFTSLDKFVLQVLDVSRGARKRELGQDDMDLFYRSSLVRLVAYAMPLAIKSEAWYPNFMKILVRKKAYERVSYGIFANFIIMAICWLSPTGIKSRSRNRIIKSLACLAGTSVWSILWTMSVKSSLDRAIAHDIQTTTNLIQEEEKWILDGHRPKLATIIRCATFGAMGLGALRIMVSFISASYNTYYDLVEDAVDGKEIKPDSALGNVTQHDIEIRDSVTNVWAGSSKPFDADTMVPPQFLNKIAGGTLAMLIDVPGKQDTIKRTSAIMLRQGVVMFPRHNWFDNNCDPNSRTQDSMRVKFVRHDMTGGFSGTNWTETIYWSTTVIIPGTDVCISRVNLGGPFLNLLPYFHASPTTQPLFLGQGRGKDGKLYTKRGALSFKGKHKVDYFPELTCEYYKAEMRDECWADGDCATVIVNDGPKPRICGLHLLGHTTKPYGLSVVLTKSMMEVASKMLDDKLETLNTYLTNSLLETPYRIGDMDYNISNSVHPASPVNRIPEDGCFNVLGTIVTGTNTYKSAYHMSPLTNYLIEDMGIVNQWMIPAFKKKDGWDPWEKITGAMSKPSSKMDPILLSRAVDDYCDGLSFGDQDLDYLKPLTNTEILCGIDGKRFIDGIKLQTSCGCPMKGKKDRYIVPVDVPTHQRGLDFTQDYQKMWTFLEELENDYDKGIKKGYIFKTSLKDEVVTKIKARGFYCAPLLLSLHMRKYVTPLLRLMCMNPLLTECAVGLNPFSPEWHEMHEYLVYFGENQIIAGDHKEWDLRQNPALMIGGAKCFQRMAAFGNYTSRDKVQLRGSTDEVIYPVVDVNGTVVQPYGMMTSGHNATANWNSLGNSLSLRMCFYKYYPNLVFRDHVHLITYGDDFVCGVSVKCPEFNFNNIQKFFREECDMVVTYYDKTENAPNYSSIFEVDFLKRRSVLLGDTGYYVGAIETNSIYKPLFWTKAKKSEVNSQVIEAITSALHEMFYVGEKEYNNFVSHMQLAVDKLGLTMPGLRVSYNDRMLLWKEKYMGLVLDNDSTPETLAEARDFIGQPSDDQGEITHPLCTEKLGAWRVNYTLENRTNKKDSVFPSYIGNDVMHVSDALSTQITTSEGIKEFVVQSAIQSGTEVDNVSNSLMQFNLRSGAFMTGLTHEQDETFDVATSEGSEIGDFFHRPLKIYDFSWEPFAPLSTEINLFKEYVTNKRVVNRLTNYSFLSGTMCIRIACNGSPYHYGKAIAALNYWPLMDTAILSANINVNQASQLPHIVVNPTMGTAGCLEVPLYHPYNAVNLINPERVVDLVFRTVNALQLASATPSDATPIKVTVWAWMKDYKLISPTSREMVDLVPQSDEYQQKPVARAATATANAFGALASLPHIGKYARISEVAMRVAGEIASVLGFSRPLSITSEMKMANRPIGNLTNANYEDSSTKLSLDIKQEVTIDSSVTGYIEDNDMLLINVAQRESLVYSGTWDSSSSFLPKIIVSPLIAPSFLSDGIRYFNTTPMSYVSMPFRYWRGNIKFRIEVVGSAFHRGKLRIVYDPYDTTTTSWVIDSNINYSHIMDLAEEREYLMDVGWATNRPYLSVGSPDVSFITLDSSAPIGSYDANWHNGTINIFVEHPLRSVGDDVAPSVYLNIYVSAGDNFQLAEPSDNLIKDYANNYPLRPQSIEETPGVGQAPSPSMMPDLELNQNPSASYSVADKYDLTFFGESIISIRQLVKRYCANYVRNYSSEDVEFFKYHVFNSNDFPNYGGWTPTGLDTSSTDGQVNWCTYSNYLNWYTPMFLMRRGGIRNKYIIVPDKDTANYVSEFTVARSETVGTFSVSTVLDFLGNFRWFINQAAEQSLLNGAQSTIAILNPTLEIECPYYSPKRFFFAQDRDKESQWTQGDIRKECGHKYSFITSDPIANGYVRRYTAAADDYSLYMFKYSPVIYNLEMAPPIS